MAHNNNANRDYLNVRNSNLSKCDFNKFDKNMDGRNKSIQVSKSLLYSIIFLFILSTPVFAGKEFKTNLMRGGFISSMNPNFNYTSNPIEFKPSDGVTNITYVKVNYFVDTTSITKFSVVINNKSCNPVNYVIPANVNRYQMIFDCTGLIEYGTFISSIWSNATIKNFYGDYEVSYINNPYSISTAGTEYQSGNSARNFVRLLDSNSRPINLGICNQTIYYPNNTKFINNQLMTFLERGYYYYDFAVPSVTGNYIVSFDCTIPNSPFTQKLVITGTSIPNGNSYENDFGFDNSNNMTIISANMTVVQASGAAITAYFNGVQLGSQSGASTKTYIMNQSTFITAVEQHFSLASSGGTSTVNSVELNITYNALEPQQVVRGQNEIHVNPSYQVTLSNETINATITNVQTVGTVENQTGINFIGGTEYQSNETGIWAIQYLDAGTPRNDADYCNATFYFPNGTRWRTNVQFPRLGGSNAIYYNQTTLPNVEGIYTIDGMCKRGSKYLYAGETFHVAPWANRINNISINVNATVDNTPILNAISGMNNTVNSSFVGTNNLINNQNQQIYNYLQTINSTINSSFSGINNQFQNVNGSFIGLNNMITNTNTSLSNQMILLQSTISTQLSNVNVSISNQITTLDNNIMPMLSSVNVTVTNTQTRVEDLFLWFENKISVIT